MQKIGIIGNGFVGNSIAFGFSPTHEIRIHDKDKKRADKIATNIISKYHHIEE